MSITTPQQSGTAGATHHYVAACVREVPRRLEAVTADTFGGLTAASTHSIRSCQS
jgi:hypothetical protein